jgi:hypothetical protein
MLLAVAQQRPCGTVGTGHLDYLMTCVLPLGKACDQVVKVFCANSTALPLLRHCHPADRLTNYVERGWETAGCYDTHATHHTPHLVLVLGFGAFGLYCLGLGGVAGSCPLAVDCRPVLWMPPFTAQVAVCWAAAAAAPLLLRPGAGHPGTVSRCVHGREGKTCVTRAVHGREGKTATEQRASVPSTPKPLLAPAKQCAHVAGLHPPPR